MLFGLIAVLIVTAGEAPYAPERADMDAVLASIPAAHAPRYERFHRFYIRGVCGTRDLDRKRAFGINAVRGYTMTGDGATNRLLDEAHARGMMVVVSEWMPKHGENKGRDGATWTFDYTAQADTMVAGFTEKIEAIGDHPAILMWGLGNEVPLEEPYLRVVDRMSRAIHERYPDHLTSLTMINAKPEHIARIQRFAPDLDVIGVQSYSPGAVRGAIKNMETHWRKPFYFSEFNGKGPWNFRKTEWGTAHDNLSAEKVEDVRQCFEAIHASPLCLGSTIFTWGHFGQNRPTYFSLHLGQHPDGPVAGQGAMMATPQAEVVAEVFRGAIPGSNRAPRLTSLTFKDGSREARVAQGRRFGLFATAIDPDGPAPKIEFWVLDASVPRAQAVSGPYRADEHGSARLPAPGRTGPYLVIAYATDGDGGVSASTMPMLVEPRTKRD